MPAPIAPVTTSIASIPLVPRVSADQSQPGVFQEILNQSVQSVEQRSAGAQASVDRFLSGETEELHHVAIATQSAELSFELFMQVRNKVVQAYQDVMRIQV